MLVKIILKLLLKAIFPIVMVAGIASYGLYLKGGDPMKMWSTVGNRIAGSIRESGANTAQSIRSLSPVGEGSQSNTTVYSWVDGSGTTHFGSYPPPGVTARTMSINSNVNVVAPTVAPEPISSSRLTSGSSSRSSSHSSSRSNGRTVQTRSDASDFTENLPGIAGMQLPVNIDPEDLGMNREELLNLLQRR